MKLVNEIKELVEGKDIVIPNDIKKLANDLMKDCKDKHVGNELGKVSRGDKMDKIDLAGVINYIAGTKGKKFSDLLSKLKDINASLDEKKDIFAVGNPDKEIKGMDIKKAVAKYDFKDEVSPVLDDSNKIIGFIYASDGDDSFNGTKLKDMGQEEIKGVWVYRV